MTRDITAELRDTVILPTGELNGRIYGDTKGRYTDGTRVITTPAIEWYDDIAETGNSYYRVKMRVPGVVTDEDNGEILRRHEVDKQQYAEIAAKLRMPIGTVRSRLSRARAKRERMGGPRFILGTLAGKPEDVALLDEIEKATR